MWWWSVALVRLAWDLGAGCGLVVVALLASWLGLRAVAGQLRAGRYSGPVAFHRFRLIRAQAGLLLAFSGLFFAVWSSTLAQGQDLPPPAWIAVATLSILTSLALYAVLAAWLLTPRAWVMLRGSAFRTSAYVAYVVRAVLLGYVPILLFIETAALLFVFDLALYRWLLLPVVALWVGLVGFISPWLRTWLTGAVPLEHTPWADLAPRILAWAKLAGVQVDDLRVDYIEDGNADNAVLAGLRRRTLFLGAELLETTDWRQRDSVIGHELGHARLRHLPSRVLIDILRISLFAALILTAVDPSFAYALFPSLARDPAAPSARALALAPLVVGGIAAASLIVSSIDRRRRHRAELDCDRFSAHLTGDPLAMAVVLHTIITLIGYPLKQRSRTHPTFSQRQQAMMQLLYQPGPRAPWAYAPVPSAVPYVEPPFTYTVPLDQAPPPAPVQAHPPMAPPPFAPAAPLPPYLPVPAYAGMPQYPPYPPYAPYAPAGVFPPVPPYVPAPAFPAYAGAPAYPGMPPNTDVPPYAPMPPYLPLLAYPPYPPYPGYPPLPLYAGMPGIPPYAPVPPYAAPPAPAAPPTPPATSPEPEPEPEPEPRPGQQ